MAEYRKKPVVIEAWNWDGRGFQTVAPAWVLNYTYEGRQVRLTQDNKLRIPTLEGEMFARQGDWIIKGVKGELYPCKPDIFETTYEAVEASP